MSIPIVSFLSGRKIPKLGLGTWLIGGAATRDPNNDDVGQIKSLKDAIDSGFTFIRTAHNYAEGYCEELVGKVIKNYDREKLFLVSAANQKFAVDKQSLIEIAKGSLKNLQTDYFDLYLIGAVNPEVSIKEMMDGLVFLQENGLTKDIGVSNYRLSELKAAVNYLGKKVVYDEMHYNLIIREPEIDGTLEYCRQNGIILSAYRPLQLGQLSKPGILLLDEIAAKYKKSQSQIALKWLVQKEGVITMTKVLNSSHIREDLDIFDWDLDKEDMEKLNKDFPIQIRTSDCSLPRTFKL
ncbi:MAG: Aldo/keto reductase [Candidatus Falkowbacteria bacterium GW2011_GWA2_39_24]|uniref:Aldo/keto reductase n=1 Tax=Candidatus Falkowbacteria bacterium GW2011_GWA2_39_24 TaxID=1618634 RepID=A0A0G0NH46_9BACT|nr:MAG: Aldo/keto reductase [Candidatus Falkowbacteria bacterium GW2011_GWA2_39_24]